MAVNQVTRRNPVGRMVLYRMTRADVENYKEKVAALRKIADATPEASNAVPYGSIPAPGDIFPAVIVRMWDVTTGCSNLRVFLDGELDLWSTSRNFHAINRGDGMDQNFDPDFMGELLEGHWTWL